MVGSVLANSLSKSYSTANIDAVIIGGIAHSIIETVEIISCFLMMMMLIIYTINGAIISLYNKPIPNFFQGKVFADILNCKPSDNKAKGTISFPILFSQIDGIPSIREVGKNNATIKAKNGGNFNKRSVIVFMLIVDALKYVATKTPQVDKMRKLPGWSTNMAYFKLSSP